MVGTSFAELLGVGNLGDSRRSDDASMGFVGVGLALCVSCSYLAGASFGASRACELTKKGTVYTSYAHVLYLPPT